MQSVFEYKTAWLNFKLRSTQENLKGAKLRTLYTAHTDGVTASVQQRIRPNTEYCS